MRFVGGGNARLDAGTIGNLFEAGEFERTVQRAQGLPIAIVEEIVYENGWNHSRPAHGVRGTLWQEYVRAALKGIADGDIMLVPNKKN